MSALSSEVLIPAGRALLLGTFGASLIESMRGKHPLALSFERLMVAAVALTFYKTLALGLESISDLLTGAISGAGRDEDLRTYLLEILKHASQTSAPGGSATSFNIPEVLEQAWRTGVWGVMTALVEGFFLIVSFVLECTRDVLWQLLLLLFPLAAGAFPLFPKIMTNLMLYAVELSLWLPMLCLIERMTGQVAREHLTKSGSLGLSILGVECVAIVLILAVPAVTHRFLSGAFNGDMGSQGSAFTWVRTIAAASRGMPTGGGT